jgi:hypothetical protein
MSDKRPYVDFFEGFYSGWRNQGADFRQKTVRIIPSLNNVSVNEKVLNETITARGN